MGLSDYKINSFSKPVSALDDTPKMSASELKEWFDSNSTNELKKSVNGIIDELKDVDINKQHTHDNKDILDAINEDVTQFKLSKQHTHENKDILDDISADTYATKAEVGDIETALDSIIAIQKGLIGGGNV